MTKLEMFLGGVLVAVTGGYIYSVSKTIYRVKKSKEIAEQMEETCENIKKRLEEESE